jgi:hypothetical protein
VKKKPLKLRLSSFFGQRIHRAGPSGNLPALIKPESVGEIADRAIEDILRWADDGGKMLDLGSRTTRSDPQDARERRNQERMSQEKLDNDGS